MCVVILMHSYNIHVYAGESDVTVGAGRHRMDCFREIFSYNTYTAKGHVYMCTVIMKVCYIVAHTVLVPVPGVLGGV